MNEATGFCPKTSVSSKLVFLVVMLILLELDTDVVRSPSQGVGLLFSDDL